ncbi:hypothetical protein AAVH_01330 [Aphelenchoides avenae]|nr:hypothetical protein AAVH_01330 [Aphelenchus avenae]
MPSMPLPKANRHIHDYHHIFKNAWNNNDAGTHHDNGFHFDMDSSNFSSIDYGFGFQCGNEPVDVSKTIKHEHYIHRNALKVNDGDSHGHDK